MTFESEQPVVPDGVAEVLAVLNAAGVVVGPHDEILQATGVARTLGLVRGNRVALPELLELVRSVRRDGAGRHAELEIDRGARAATLHLEARVAPLGDELVLIVADDQTASRRVEQTRRDFVANVSHELKTPIGAISLLAEAVEEAADDPPAVRKFAGRMSIESARLTDLVGQIIDLSRLQADDPLAKPKEVDVDALLADAVDRCRVDAEQHQVTLALGRPSGGARCWATARQLRYGDRQPGRERRRLLRPRRPGRGRRPPAGRERRRLCRDHRLRQRDRHPARGAGAHLRALLPGRLRPQPGQRRHAASGSRSSSTSPPATAARSRSGAGPARGRPSPSGMPAHLAEPVTPTAARP